MDWLKEDELVGELLFDRIRGKEVYHFVFDKRWLSLHSDIRLGEDLGNYSSEQFSKGDIFGCFSDSLPDRWGRVLAERREQILAQQEHRPLRHLSSFDYLKSIDDFSRMGAFRFKEQPDGPYINSEDHLSIPPIVYIRKLLDASWHIERSEEEGMLPEDKWIEQLYHPGTSLGGARPKSSVMDENGRLCIAKFPSRKDRYDVALWEHLCHLLAKKAGINVAETRVISIGDSYHTLISVRFDRGTGEKRIHFASSMNLLGFTDGDGADTGKGYLDIADVILRYGTNVQKNLEELFRRVAFNICVGNSDDHFRNHGFLLSSKGWQLSPAYDLNPSLSHEQSLMISDNSCSSSLTDLLEACEDYYITSDVAADIIHQVRDAVHSWRETAGLLHIAPSEQQLFASRLDEFQ